MTRISRDELGLRLAHDWSLRGTCARRRVGCVLTDVDGYGLSAGYNGPASGQDHCTSTPCPGAGMASGTGLSTCEAIHAEANALMRCPDVRRIHACFVTTSPCVDCVKLLLNTECRRIVFAERYAHDEAAKALWTRGPVTIARRTWEQRAVSEDRVSTLFDAIKHGDEVHRAWLREAIDDHFAGRLVRRPS